MNFGKLAGPIAAPANFQHSLLLAPDENRGLVALRAAVRIRANADVIVTINLRDFPSDITAPFGIEAQPPDDFVLTLLDSDPEAVVAAAESHRLSLKNPAKSLGEYLEALQRQGLVGAVQAFRSPSLQVLATGHRMT